MRRYVDTPQMDKILSLSKRRGLVFQSSEIYGGINATWDYGPLGVELKRNLKDLWWSSVVQQRDDVVGLDAAILMHPEVWVSSGHVASFSDPLVECRECHQRYREDQIKSTVCPAQCPDCGGELTDPRQFSLMFKTFMGPVEDTAHQVYLRPETAQGIFVNFANVLTASRRKLPFGIAQIGKAFRNEITPGNFTFRTREFEQMEIEYFVKPGTDDQWLRSWLDDRFSWYTKHGIRPENLRLRRHDPDELAHYAKDTYDIEYRFPWGWGELEGIANRTDYDLRSHATPTGQDLTFYDEETKEHVFPYVIEPSGGVDRATLAFLLDSYDEEPDPPPKPGPVTSGQPQPAPASKDVRVVLRLHQATGPGESGRAASEPQRAPSAPRPPSAHVAATPPDHPVRRCPEHRPALPPPRRNRHPLLRHRRFRLAGRPARHTAGPRYHDPTAGAHRRPPGHPHRQTGARLVASNEDSPLLRPAHRRGKLQPH